MAHRNLEQRLDASAVLRYGFAVVAVAIVLGLSLISGVYGFKDVELPETMRRAMAAQAEAERERRAKVIHAQGEYQSAADLARAAQLMEDHPAALQLRVLGTMVEVSAGSMK